jgi:mRNA (guanine-N7-)-methyltransferase
MFEIKNETGLKKKGIVGFTMSRKRAEGEDGSIHRGQEVLEHYSKRSNASRSERQNSRSIGVKSMNNWVKAVTINRLVKKEAVVLDICGGKGGDLFKWERSGASCVVLIDGADGSIRDALERYQNSNLPKSKFVALFGVADCFAVRLSDVLPKELSFDIVSCQFAAHYAWATESKSWFVCCAHN